MALIRHVSCPVAGVAQVLPPDGADHGGNWSWEIVNPTGSGGQVELVDDPSKAIGVGRPLAAGATFVTVADGAEEVWALGPATGSPVIVIVTGTEHAAV